MNVGVAPSTVLPFAIVRLCASGDALVKSIVTLPAGTVNADLSSNAASNSLIMTDTQANIRRVVEIVANLVTGSNRIRLAAYTLSTLPVFVPEEGQAELESVAVAGAVLRDSYASSHRWYEEFAELLSQQRSSLDEPPDHDDDDESSGW